MPNSPHLHHLFDLTGRVFLVTGGARTLGRDMALALAEAGADGIITSRDPARAAATAGELAASTGRRVIGLGLDATDESAVAAVFARIAADFGGLDILVNSAGGGASGNKAHPVRFDARPREAWDALQAVNVTSAFLVTKHAIPLLTGRRGANIINIASIAGIVGRDRRMYPPDMRPQTVDYAAAKGAIIAMTRDLAATLGRDGIRVNAISPGGFERGQPPAFVQAYADRTPLGRMGRDGVDLKGAAVFLASDAAAYVSGHNLVVDGGFSAWQ